MNRKQRRTANKGNQRSLAQLQKIDPQDPVALARIVTAAAELVRRGKAAEAAPLYRKALEATPDNPIILANYGYVLAVLGRQREAATIYEKASALDPGNVVLLTNRGGALRLLGQFDEALACYRKALEVAPDHAETFYQMAETYIRMGDQKLAAKYYGDALRHFQIGATTRPGDEDVLARMAKAFLKLNRADLAIHSARRALAINPNHANAHFYLATALERTGAAKEAIAGYRRATLIDPGYGDAHRALAHLLTTQGKLELAVKSYRRTLHLQPHDISVRHFLAAASGKAPAAPPDGYVESLFDGYAERFDHHLVENLGYKGPELMYQAIGQATGVEAAEWSVIDLGCGTGLCGPLVRKWAARLKGVDLSEGMLAKARERGVYDDLLCADLTTALSAESRSIDLAFATDVFVYIGDLAPVFAACRAAVKPGGWFIFTTETSKDAPFQLNTTGRYSHSSAYIAALADSHEFRLISQQDVATRMESSQPVAGQIHVLQAIA